MVYCSNMCREAILTFAGHFFINSFTLADAGVHVAYLTGAKKSLYTHRDEKNQLEDIKEFKKYLPNAIGATKDFHDDFKDTIDWIIPNLSDCLRRAVKNKALQSHEWVDLLKWWFDEVHKEFYSEVN